MNGFWDRLKEMSAGLNQQQQTLFDRQLNMAGMMQNQANIDADMGFKYGQAKQGLLGALVDAERGKQDYAQRERDLDLRRLMHEDEYAFKDRSLSQEYDLALKDFENRLRVAASQSGRYDAESAALLLQILNEYNNMPSRSPRISLGNVGIKG